MMTKSLFEERTHAYQSYIEGYLSRVFEEYQTEPQRDLYDAMQYSLLSGGKRLRPIFVFEFCRMCGGDWKQAAPFAAAIEMIHTYSLIHDDLPCMDNDDFRRGKPTNHKVYGEAIAVLAGDALLTDAFSVAASIRGDRPVDLGAAISILSRCAGSAGMVGGQVLDIQSEERILSEQEVLDIQSRKTGALIRAACMLGVIAGGGSQEQRKSAESFAGALGLAFQIRDDMLDVVGSAQELGKSVGTDGQKNTFVRLYGLEKCEMMVHNYTNDAKAYLQAFGENDYMLELAEALTTRRT